MKNKDKIILTIKEADIILDLVDKITIESDKGNLFEVQDAKEKIYKLLGFDWE